MRNNDGKDFRIDDYQLEDTQKNNGDLIEGYFMEEDKYPKVLKGSIYINENQRVEFKRVDDEVVRYQLFNSFYFNKDKEPIRTEYRYFKKEFLDKLNKDMDDEYDPMCLIWDNEKGFENPMNPYANGEWHTIKKYIHNGVISDPKPGEVEQYRRVAYDTFLYREFNLQQKNYVVSRGDNLCEEHIKYLGKQPKWVKNIDPEYLVQTYEETIDSAKTNTEFCQIILTMFNFVASSVSGYYIFRKTDLNIPLKLLSTASLFSLGCYATFKFIEFEPNFNIEDNPIIAKLKPISSSREL